MARDRRLVQTLLYLHQQLVKAADAEEMTMSQYHLLHFLHEQPRRASDFAEITKLRKPGITSVVSVLESRGWIARSPDPSDARAQIISMTDRGREVFLAFEDDMDEALRQFLGNESVQRANTALGDLYKVWNEKRIARFESFRALLHKRKGKI